MEHKAKDDKVKANGTIQLKSVVVIVLLTAIVVGFGVYKWQAAADKGKLEMFQAKIRGLEVRIDQMKQFRIQKLEELRAELQGQITRVEQEHQLLVQENIELQSAMSQIKDTISVEQKKKLKVVPPVPAEEVILPLPDSSPDSEAGKTVQETTPPLPE